MFNVIAAVDRNRGIGRDGVLPWLLKRDVHFFKMLTTSCKPLSVQREFGINSRMQDSASSLSYGPDGMAVQCENSVIMGRKTWDSLPETARPLPNRYNIILSRITDRKSGPGFIFAGSFEEALGISSRKGPAQTYVIGGQNIFQLAVNHPGCGRIYLTEIMHEYNCDVFFPEIASRYKETGSSPLFEESSIGFRFRIFLRQ